MIIHVKPHYSLFTGECNDKKSRNYLQIEAELDMTKPTRVFDNFDVPVTYQPADELLSSRVLQSSGLLLPAVLAADAKLQTTGWQSYLEQPW